VLSWFSSPVINSHCGSWPLHSLYTIFQIRKPNDHTTTDIKERTTILWRFGWGGDWGVDEEVCFRGSEDDVVKIKLTKMSEMLEPEKGADERRANE